jgi:hypothetical protein
LVGMTLQFGHAYTDPRTLPLRTTSLRAHAGAVLLSVWRVGVGDEPVRWGTKCAVS